MKELQPSKPLNCIVIESAMPFLSTKPSRGGFGYYVKHWNVTGYRWDGDCMCSKQTFAESIPIQDLEIKRSKLISIIDQILK